ncbi:MAG: hypothetical protein ACJAZY_003372 [Spirosomataceae bacterium]|jgi:hypothetical protein
MNMNNNNLLSDNKEHTTIYKINRGQSYFIISSKCDFFQNNESFLVEVLIVIGRKMFFPWALVYSESCFQMYPMHNL